MASQDDCLTGSDPVTDAVLISWLYHLRTRLFCSSTAWGETCWNFFTIRWYFDTPHVKCISSICNLWWKLATWHHPNAKYKKVYLLFCSTGEKSKIWLSDWSFFLNPIGWIANFFSTWINSVKLNRLNIYVTLNLQLSCNYSQSVYLPEFDKMGRDGALWFTFETVSISLSSDKTHSTLICYMSHHVVNSCIIRDKCF